MAGKFMSVKKLIIPVMSLVILVSQLTGCVAMSSKDMVKMIDSGQTVTLELAKPNYAINVKGKQQSKLDWTQLDQLQTYSSFRQDIDSLLNINTVTNNEINGKSGCLYVDSEGDRDGNTTLADAFRNKTFVTKYWHDTTVRNKLVKLASEAYTDVGKNDTYALAAALNAYYNLLPDASDPSSFNGSMSLSREQFYALDYKAQNGVKILENDSVFDAAIGGSTTYSKFAQEVDQYGFLSMMNKSLDKSSYRGSISRAEAIYLIVNQNFSKQLSSVTGKEKAFSDTKNAGDLALAANFKYKNDAKKIVSKDRWQAYTLAYMLQHPSDGMQEELYKSMVVAKDLGLISGSESRWDEPISKAEAIQLMVNTEIAKNKLSGYKSTAEYGKMDMSKFKISTETAVVTGTDANGMKYGNDWAQTPTGMSTADPNKKLLNGMTLLEMRKTIDKDVATLKASGESDAEIKNDLDDILKNIGTSYDEVMSLPAPQPSQPSTVTQPSTSTPSSSSSSTSGSSSSSTSGSSSSSTSGSSSRSKSSSSSDSSVSTSKSDLNPIFKENGKDGDVTLGNSGESSGLSDTQQN